MPIARYGGFLLPPIMWAATTQMGQILPYPDCSGGWRLTAIVTLCAAAIAFVSSALSARGLRRADGRTAAFLAGLSLLVGLALSFAIILQGSAALLVSPCLR